VAANDPPLDASRPVQDSAQKEGTFGQNALWSTIAWVASGVAAFICVPITVRGLGADAYGLIALVTALTGYAGLVELGLSQSLVRYLSYYRALGEGRPMIAIMRFALIWFTAAGSVAGLVLFLNASWLATHLLHVSADLLPSAVMVIRLSAINLVVDMLLTIGMAVPVSFLRYDIAAGVSGVFTVLTWVGPAVVVLLGYGAVAVVAFYLGANVVALLFYLYFGRRLFRSVRRDVGPEWREIRHKVLSFAGLIAASRIGTTAAVQTNRLMVGITNSTAAAAYYQVPNVLASKVFELSGKIASVLFPTGTAMIARRDYEGVRALYFKSSRLLFLVNASALTATAVYAHPLLEYWVSPVYADQGTVALAIFAVTMALNAAALPTGFLTWSAARPGVNLVFAYLNAGISLATIYPLASRFGVNGAAMAGLLGALVQPFFIHYFNRRIIDVSSAAVFRRCYVPTFAGASVAGVASYFLLLPYAGSLAITLVLLCVTALLAFVISGVFGAVSKEELHELRVTVSSIGKRMRIGREARR
jgi:O-antigen/teichoic acid export membrane protein